jgi:hypothetical protein
MNFLHLLLYGWVALSAKSELDNMAQVAAKQAQNFKIFEDYGVSESMAARS